MKEFLQNVLSGAAFSLGFGLVYIGFHFAVYLYYGIPLVL